MSRNEKFNLIACSILGIGGAILFGSVHWWLSPFGFILGFGLAMSDNVYDAPNGNKE